MNKTYRIPLIALGIVLNIVGAFIALTLNLPIYIDSIGTILISIIFGPFYGVITGLLGSITSGIVFDIYSLFFAPVQIFTGLLFGLCNQKGLLNGYRLIIFTFLNAIVIGFVSAIISAMAFGGITSSGSTYLVIVLKNFGVNLVLSVFIVQFLTDFFDKLLAVYISKLIANRIPQKLLNKYSK